MPKTIDFTLSDTELSQIEQIIKTSKSSRLVKRATGLRMLHFGHSSYEVGRVLSVSAPTVYSWFHRWKAEGLKGLENRPKSGRPAVADEVYLKVVEETLEQDPGELGYDFTLWTIQRLNQHVSQVTGKQISDERLRLILQARGWVYRRPKEDLGALQDKEARKWAEEFLEEIKKAPSKSHLSSFSLWTKRP
jgi:transposase